MKLNFGFPFSASLSKKSCGGAGVISELSLTLPQCFTSHSPPQSVQGPGPGLMMLLFVLVWLLISGVRGRGACVVETLLLRSANEGATALRVPCKLAPVCTLLVLLCQPVRYVMQKFLKHLLLSLPCVCVCPLMFIQN